MVLLRVTLASLVASFSTAQWPVYSFPYQRSSFRSYAAPTFPLGPSPQSSSFFGSQFAQQPLPMSPQQFPQQFPQMFGMQQPSALPAMSPMMNPNDAFFMNTMNSRPTLAPSGGPFGGGPMSFQGPSQNLPFTQWQQDPSQSISAPQPSQSNSGVRRLVPPFLEGTDQDTQDRFFAIVQDPNEKYEQKKEKIEQLVASLDEQRQKAYKDFLSSTSGEDASRRQKVHSLVTELSPEAQVQFQKVSALLTNPQLSEGERWQKVQALYDALSSSLREEFNTKFAGF